MDTKANNHEFASQTLYHFITSARKDRGNRLPELRGVALVVPAPMAPVANGEWLDPKWQEGCVA